MKASFFLCILFSFSEMCPITNGMADSVIIPDSAITGTSPSTPDSSPSDVRDSGFKVPTKYEDGSKPNVVVELTAGDNPEAPLLVDIELLVSVEKC